MRLIDEFVDKVLNSDDAFALHEKKDIYHYYLQGKVGKAKFVYGARGYDERFYVDLAQKPELVAVVADGTVYIVDAFELDVHLRGVVLPEHTRMFDVALHDINEHFTNVVFVDYYDKLDIVEITEEKSIARCKADARLILLSENPVIEQAKEKSIYSGRDLLNILCGFANAEDKCNEYLSNAKEDWVALKSKNAKIAEFMESADTAPEWELRLAKGLREVNAASVTAEFERNGKRASAKIRPCVITRNLKENDYFTDYSFCVTKRGEELIEYLGAGNSGWNKENPPLYCKDISKITYGKKVLYVRE